MVYFVMVVALLPAGEGVQKELTPDFVANTLVDSCVLCHSAAFRAVALEIDLFRLTV
jgi:hypothetical protein